MTPSEIARLHRLLDRLTPVMRAEVERALNRLRRRLKESDLLEIIERGDSIVLARAVRRLSADLQPALKTLAQAFVAGRVAATVDLPASIRNSFTLTNPFAVRAAENHAARFVTGVSQETRRAIRAVVAEGFKQGITPREIAKLIRPVIGLTKRQAIAVVTRRAADTASGMAADRVTARAATYAAKLLKQRATMIARTEIISASTAGQVQLWKEAQAEGLLPELAEKVWIVTPDDRLCPICEAMEGETAPIGGMFHVDGEAVIGPPAHPNCRCAVGIEAKSVGVRRAA